MSTATVATHRTRRIVAKLAAGTWSAMQTYGALVMASYGYPLVPEDTSESECAVRTPDGAYASVATYGNVREISRAS